MIRAALPQCDAFDWIYDPDGSPDTGKLVTLVKVVDASGNPISFEQRHTFTDDTGQYHFTLPQGSTAYVQARASGLWAANGPVAFAVPNAASGQLVPTVVPEAIVGAQPPLILDGSTLSIARASTTQDGYLAAEDFALFAEGGAGVGSVTQINTGVGLTGGPITDTGTIALAAVSGLTPGIYPNPTIQVDAYGRVIAISTAGDTTPPVISAVTASNIAPTTCTISWTTDEQSSSQVEFGTTTAYGSSTTPDTTAVTAHSQNLTGLIPGTFYHYRVKSRDISSNLATSVDNTFTTLAAGDTTPPVISAVNSSSITAAGATITWTTNENSDSQVEYGTTTAYGASTALDSSLVTSHSQPISGLTASTLYHYRVKSKDAAANLATGTDNTFTTAAASDVTPPVISSVTSGSIAGTTATITWTTNEPADSQVEYGGSTSYGSSTTLDPTLVTNHSVNLTGLTGSTLYHYRVKSKDAASNMATSSDFTFSTTGPFSPTTVPGMISWQKADALALSNGAAVASWTDSSPNGFPCTQSNGVSQPIFETALVNSLPAVHFDGGNDNMNMTFTSDRGQPNTYYYVIKINAVSHLQDHAVFGSNNRNLVGFVSGKYQMYAGALLESVAAATLSQWIIVEAIFDSASSLMTINGASVMSGDAGTQPFGGGLLGASENGSNPFNGWIAEYIAYDTRVSDPDRTSLRTYLGAKYAITTT